MSGEACRKIGPSTHSHAYVEIARLMDGRLSEPCPQRPLLTQYAQEGRLVHRPRTFQIRRDPLSRTVTRSYDGTTAQSPRPIVRRTRRTGVREFMLQSDAPASVSGGNQSRVLHRGRMHPALAPNVGVPRPTASRRRSAHASISKWGTSPRRRCNERARTVGSAAPLTNRSPLSDDLSTRPCGVYGPNQGVSRFHP